MALEPIYDRNNTSIMCQGASMTASRLVLAGSAVMNFASAFSPRHVLVHRTALNVLLYSTINHTEHCVQRIYTRWRLPVAVGTESRAHGAMTSASSIVLSKVGPETVGGIPSYYTFGTLNSYVSGG
jgi:hypothetical protein